MSAGGGGSQASSSAASQSSVAKRHHQSTDDVSDSPWPVAELNPQTGQGLSELDCPVGLPHRTGKHWEGTHRANHCACVCVCVRRGSQAQGPHPQWMHPQWMRIHNGRACACVRAGCAGVSQALSLESTARSEGSVSFLESSYLATAGAFCWDAATHRPCGLQWLQEGRGYPAVSPPQISEVSRPDSTTGPTSGRS